MRSGMVAVVGRPNVGKSSLINALVGQKVSIVSPKPQTTRHRIQGVLHHPQGQIVFVDTPGLHNKTPRALNRVMNETAAGSLAGVDLVLLVCEAARWGDDDELALERVIRSRRPAALLLNKVDLVADKSSLLPLIAKHSERHRFEFIMPLSVRSRDNLDALVADILARLPEGPALYPTDQVVGHDPAFTAAEIVREKLMRQLRQELPYALTVETEKFEREGNLTRIHCVIWVEREGQKGIVVGAGGQGLKTIGSAARRDLEQQFGGKVFLKLWVKVRENWTDDPQSLAQFGLSSGPL